MDVVVFLFPLFCFFSKLSTFEFLSIQCTHYFKTSTFIFPYVKGFWPVSLYTKNRGMDHKLLTWVDATFKYVLCNALIVIFRSVMDI